MKYYKELNLDFSLVIPKLVELTSKKPTARFWTPLDTQQTIDQIPELLTVFEPLKLTISRISIITCIYHKSNIHRDVSPFASRMNIPVLNCEQSTTSFFVCDESYQGEKREFSAKSVHWIFDENKCTEVDSFTLTKPTLLRVQELHQVRINPNSRMPRISCSIGFNEDIEHLWSA